MSLFHNTYYLTNMVSRCINSSGMLIEVTIEKSKNQDQIRTWQDYTNGADYDPILDRVVDYEKLEAETGYKKGRIRVIDPYEEETFRRLRTQLIEYDLTHNNN